jgi:acyl-CoA synthetase (AMP-forming)/AMP-acid ligase II
MFHGDLADGTLAALLRGLAIEQPDAAAILAPGRSPLTFAALWRQVQRVAGALQPLGATPSVPVAVVLSNGPEMATAFLGVAACAICVPLNPASQAAELRFFLEDTCARIVILRKGEGGPLDAVAKDMGLAVLEIEGGAPCPAGQFRIDPEPPAGMAAQGLSAPHDVALILHTAGTTARPKMVPLSQANLVVSARSIARHLALLPADRCLNVMPLFHVHGLVGALLASLAGGGSTVCTYGFDEDAFFDWVAEYEPTWYTAVPTMHQSVVSKGALYRQRAPGHRFRFVRSSSAALPPKTFELLQALTGTPIVEAYGMTEASHQIASNPLPPGKQKAGSVGLAAGVEIALMDETGRRLPAGAIGEIVIRGPGITAGYWNNPDANAHAFSNGWFRTGDQGRLDEEGHLFISGRLKEIVNRGGEKISPREVDDALLEHPGVAQAVAFGVPHPSLGEDLAAAVVLRPGSEVGEPELRQLLFSRLSSFKVPSQILIIGAIPKGPIGKVQRATLHEKLGALLQRPFVPPGTGLERALDSILREVLECPPLGIHDNFFALGGDSLKGAQVIARVNAEYRLQLPVITLFRHPSITELGRAIEQAEAAARTADEAALRSEIEGLPDEEVERLLREYSDGSARG